jgi:tagaturonate reductase
MSKKLKELNRKNFPSELDNGVPKIILFGEGNFLRAFIGFIIEKLNVTTDFNGLITSVQPIEKGLGELINSQNGLYTIITKGVLNKKTINTFELIHILKEVINPYNDYEKYNKLATDKNYQIIISNTTEAGISCDDNDNFDDEPPKSYPAKLTKLLFNRYKAKLNGFIFLPCELIENNGEVLKKTILQTAKKWQLSSEFIQWIKNENIFCSTLVDRIVPGYPKNDSDEICQKIGYTDKLLVNTEPFLLWVIKCLAQEKQKILNVIPLDKFNDGNIIFTENLDTFRQRKVKLLNGPHTFMVPLGLLSNIETVKQVLENADLNELVKKVMKNEICPTIDLPENELENYSKSILERFSNPFVEHKLESIVLNSLSKWVTRLLPTLKTYYTKYNKLPQGIVFSYSALLQMYANADNYPVQDNEEFVNKIKNAFVNEKDVLNAVKNILSMENIWGENLDKIPNFSKNITYNIELIRNTGIKDAIKKTLKDL